MCDTVSLMITYPIYSTQENVKAESKKNILEIFEAFKSDTGRYPHTKDLISLSQKHKDIIPNPRSIQRRGGLRMFYEQLLGLPYVDSRTNDIRGAVAALANVRANDTEATMHSLLSSIFGPDAVEDQVTYPDQSETRYKADFRLRRENGTTVYIDIFYASDLHSLTGCVNRKVKKLSLLSLPKNATVLLVSVADGINQTQIDQYVRNRKSPLPSRVSVMHIKNAIDMLSTNANA